MAVAITRTGLSARELRAAARRTKDSYQARRLLVLALVRDGASRTAAARATGGERHVGWLLKRLGFTRLSVPPRHPQADEAAQQAFKKTSPRS